MIIKTTAIPIAAAVMLLASVAQGEETLYRISPDVSDGVLNIRKRPSANTESIGMMPANTVVPVSRCLPSVNGRASWCEVTYDNIHGWASTSGMAPATARDYFAYGISGLGTALCSETRTMNAGDRGLLDARLRLGGYITGVNLGLGPANQPRNAARGRAVSAIRTRVLAYCAANPQDKIADAAMTVVVGKKEEAQAQPVQAQSPHVMLDRPAVAAQMLARPEPTMGPTVKSVAPEVSVAPDDQVAPAVVAAAPHPASVSPPAPEQVAQAQPVASGPPSYELSLVRAAENAHAQYDAAQTDFQRGASRPERRKTAKARYASSDSRPSSFRKPTFRLSSRIGTRPHRKLAMMLSAAKLTA
jgi:Bacterial SH3 domain